MTVLPLAALIASVNRQFTPSTTIVSRGQKSDAKRRQNRPDNKTRRNWRTHVRQCRGCQCARVWRRNHARAMTCGYDGSLFSWQWPDRGQLRRCFARLRWIRSHSQTCNWRAPSLAAHRRASRAQGIVRLCLELLRKAPLATQALERRLRSFAHGLSPLRDTQAALAAIKTLRRRDRDVRAKKIWPEQVRELKARRERVLGAALMIDPGFASHRSQMAEMRTAINAIAWTRLQADDLIRACERSAKRTRRAREPVFESIAEAPRHRLRRCSRRLLLQINLLRMVARDGTRPRASATAHDAFSWCLENRSNRQRMQLSKRSVGNRPARIAPPFQPSDSPEGSDHPGPGAGAAICHQQMLE